MPSPFRNHSNRSRARGFVNPSAICSVVGMYFSSTVPRSWISPCHLRWISICFVREWNCGFEDRAIAPWLSPQMIVAAFPWLMFKSLRSLLNQIASFVACVCPRNSASQVERATTLWRFDCQLIAPLPMLKRYPAVDRLVSRHPPQSASCKAFEHLGMALVREPEAFCAVEILQDASSESYVLRSGVC